MLMDKRSNSYANLADNKLDLATPDTASEAGQCKESEMCLVQMLASGRNWSHKGFES